MGFLDKVKNMFTEEVEEAPIKKDVIQVEIPAPVAPQKVEQVTESEVLVKEEKPATPVFFDDKDFASLEPPKEAPKPRKLEDKYHKKEAEEKKKLFRPTPIISPVYGVLDKNYHKEDIAPKKKPVASSYYERRTLTVDDVREKAFGTLEDDLEKVIPVEDPMDYEIEDELIEVETPKEDIFDDLMDPDYKPKFAAHEEPEENSLEEEIIKDVNDDDLFEEMHDEVKQKDEEKDLTDSDLFNLIDSMYDKKDDE